MLLRYCITVYIFYYFSSYLDQMARDVNDQLQDLGQVTFAMLTKDYDLPGDFIKKVSLIIL